MLLKKNYQLFSLFCDFGGVLGLYVGFSILTIFEFFELFASLLWICVVRAYRGPTMAAASVGTIDASTVSSVKQSPRPPSYDGLDNADQFQLFTTNKNLPAVNC